MISVFIRRPGTRRDPGPNCGGDE